MMPGSRMGGGSRALRVARLSSSPPAMALSSARGHVRRKLLCGSAVGLVDSTERHNSAATPFVFFWLGGCASRRVMWLYRGQNHGRGGSHIAVVIAPLVVARRRDRHLHGHLGRKCQHE